MSNPEHERRGLHDAQSLLKSAVYELATGPERLKPRLARAYLELCFIRSADLPEHLRPNLEWIKSELTKRKDPSVGLALDAEPDAVYRKMHRRDGHVAYTLDSMRYAKAQRIAERICELDALLDDWLHEPAYHSLRPDAPDDIDRRQP